jgi:hypothetical protein
MLGRVPCSQKVAQMRNSTFLRARISWLPLMMRGPQACLKLACACLCDLSFAMMYKPPPVLVTRFPSRCSLKQDSSAGQSPHPATGLYADDLGITKPVMGSIASSSWLAAQTAVVFIVRPPPVSPFATVTAAGPLRGRARPARPRAAPCFKLQRVLQELTLATLRCMMRQNHQSNNT